MKSKTHGVVNQRMNKRRQMRWSGAGGGRWLLRVRSPAINGKLEQLNQAAACGTANKPAVSPLGA